MLNNFHKTTSGHWRRTPGTQKGSPFSLKGGRKKYKRRETKELGTETHSGKGVMKEKFPNTRKPSHQQVCGEFWYLRGQHNQEGKKKNSPKNTCLNHNAQQKSSPDGRVCHQQVGIEQGGADCMLRVRTRPECPEKI